MTSVHHHHPSPVHRVGVIGDVHGEHERLDVVLDWLTGQSVDAVICTGDIADGRGCINRSCALLRDAGVLTVAGNHDRWLLQDRVRHVADAHRLEDVDDASVGFLRGLPQVLELDTVAGRLLLCHGIGSNDLGKVWPGTARSAIRRSTELDELLAAGRHRFIINGHLHFRVLIDFHAALVMNAGTLKGDRAGVSVVDFTAGTVTAFAITGGRPLPGNVHELQPADGRRVWRDTAEFDGRWEPVLL